MFPQDASVNSKSPLALTRVNSSIGLLSHVESVKSMMLIVYFHGEGILFSFMIQVFLGVVASALLSYGIVKFKSLVGVMIALGYATVMLATTFISRVVGSPRLEIAGWILALPSSAIVPCYNLAGSCSLTLPVSVICAGLNAAILYFLVVWLKRPR